MTGYTLYCTVCSKSYFSRTQWNQHLIQGPHQAKVVQDLEKWTEEDKKRSLVIYSSGQLVDRGRVSLLLWEVVQWLETIAGKGLTFVTDLVLSSNGRDNMAIFQLESRKKVSKILAKLHNSTVIIKTQMVQMKAADSLLELEWSDLLERFLGLGESLLVDKTPQTKVITDSVKNRNSPSMISQFEDVLHAVKISELEINLVKEIIEEVKRILEETLLACEVGLFRNNLLNLRNNPESESYLIFMHVANSKGIFTPISREVETSLLRYIGNEKWGGKHSILHELRFPLPPDITIPSSEMGQGKCYFHPGSGVRLKLLSFPLNLKEFQLSRMLTYYTHFDTRVKPLFTLLYFWMKENRIRLAKEGIPSKDAHNLLPDPAALEWLLLFYLYYQEKILPLPKEILERAHKPIVFGGKKTCNMGFDIDLKFAEQWKEKKQDEKLLKCEEARLVSVVQIFIRFCHFCTISLKNNWGIYLRDGILFRPKMHDHSRSGCKFCILLSKETILIVHTFQETSRLSVDVDKWRSKVLPAMKQTAIQLELFVQKWKNQEWSGLLKDSLTVK